MELERRLKSKTFKHPSGCWLWLGCLDKRGRGIIKLFGHCQQANRIVWRLANGPIPEGKKVLNNCGNKKCINIQHLYLKQGVKMAYDAAAELKRVRDYYTGDPLQKRFSALVC